MPRLLRFAQLLCLLYALPAPAATAPQRIASLNLCSDQLLFELVEPARIVSVSWLAADAQFSTVADRLQATHLNHALAEELLPLAPDLVISGTYSATLASSLLERLGFPVLRLDVANSVADIYAQITLLGIETNSLEKANSLNASMKTQIESYVASLRPLLEGKSAVFFSSNGYSYGSNTLQDDFLKSLGMLNAAADLNGPAQMSLEVLLQKQPDFIIVNPASADDVLLAHPLLRHPALVKHQQLMQQLVLPDILFQCAGPAYVQAYSMLAGQLQP